MGFRREGVEKCRRIHLNGILFGKYQLSCISDQDCLQWGLKKWLINKKNKELKVCLTIKLLQAFNFGNKCDCGFSAIIFRCIYGLYSRFIPHFTEKIATSTEIKTVDILCWLK